MKRTIALIVSLSVVLLSGCARTSPVVQTNPQGEPAAAPTSGLTGVGGLSPIGAPTTPAIEPTAAPTNPAQTFTVQRGTIENVLSFSGQVAPLKANVSFGLDGVLESINVQLGQSIQQGDLLAALDLGELNSQLREARLSYAQDQQALNRSAETGRLTVQQAMLDVEDARQALEKLKAPATPVEIAAARTAVREAQANLDKVRNDSSQAKNTAKLDMDTAVGNLQTLQKQYGLAVNRMEKAKSAELKQELTQQIKDLEPQLIEAEAVVAQAVIDYDTARNNEVAAVQDAEAKLDLEQTKLETLLRGPDQFEIATLEREVRRAEVAAAKVRIDSTPDPSLSRAVESSRLAIQELEGQIKVYSLYAPFAGEVASITASAGTTVQRGDPVLTLVDRSRLEIIADSGTLEGRSDGAAPRLTSGQPVEISFSRYPGEVFAGTITQLPNDALQDAASANYHISFDAQGRSLDPGDLADLRISLSRKYDTLWLPPQAVRFNGDQAFVVVRDGDKEKRVDLLIGLVTSDKIEILGGLKENDVVIGL